MFYFKSLLFMRCYMILQLNGRANGSFSSFQGKIKRGHQPDRSFAFLLWSLGQVCFSSEVEKRYNFRGIPLDTLEQ